MADTTAKYVPGTQINEAATGNIFIYVEATETLKAGVEVAVDIQLGRAKHQPDIAGIYMPFAKTAENIGKGQYGLVLVKGATDAFNEAMRQRGAAAAKSAGIALATSPDLPPNPLKKQTRSTKRKA